ncbi:MAG: RlmE family RNA methyltransferase [Treponema sp.]|nr:RlmE family RNA methyltransferase [Treponema sp.]
MADYKKPDPWQIKARKEGYPARSVYKLQELDEKFGLLKSIRPFRVLDLGAAPGSWSLYMLRKMSRISAPGAFLASADLSPLSRQFDNGLFDGENFRFVQGDITDPAIRDSILSHGPYGLIISDAAPATMGNRFVDTCRSLELAEEVVAYAENALADNGNMVVKVFQGGDTSELLKRLRGLFKTAKSHKPQACRSESFETYYLGLGKRPIQKTD